MSDEEDERSASGAHMRERLAERISEAKKIAFRFVKEVRDLGEDEFTILLAVHSIRKIYRKRARRAYRVKPFHLTEILNACSREVEDEVYSILVTDPRLLVKERRGS